LHTLLVGVSPDGTLLVDITVGVEVSKDIVGVGHTWHFVERVTKIGTVISAAPVMVTTSEVGALT
jgi:hypothetical protein